MAFGPVVEVDDVVSISSAEREKEQNLAVLYQLTKRSVNTEFHLIDVIVWSSFSYKSWSIQNYNVSMASQEQPLS